MCGIVGSACAPRESREWISNATLALKHRGPDDKGTYINSGISLGMCRLAIVEIDDGRQPGTDLTEKIHLVFSKDL